MTEYLLEARGICKSYGDLVANDNINLAVSAGVIHALIGENGAGKSTLVNILYGTVSADAGSFFWRGREVKIDSPQTAREMGIGIVFQHFALFESLTVAENIALGAKTDGDFRALSEKYDISIDPSRRVSDLSAGEKQRVEILRCLLQSPRLLILDEPTSVLTPGEARSLFTLLKRLADEGCGVLFISHKLDEVEALCEDVLVLRGGRTVGQRKMAETDRAELIRMMVGENISSGLKRAEKFIGPPLFNLENISTAKLSVPSLQLKPGVITGIAGIAGNGQDALLNMLSGETTTMPANVRFEGKNIGAWGVRRRNAAGILAVPTERHNRAAVNDLSLSENALINRISPSDSLNGGFINTKKLTAFADEIIRRFDVVTKDAQTPASALSGGNLQKYIVGRALIQNPRVLLIANPTWGVDVAAAAFVRREIQNLSDTGCAVLVISEDLDELFFLCDEIAVINKGRLGEVHPIASIGIEDVGRQMAVSGAI